jgi:transcriptional regulator with XRE-family HTH domain
MVSRLYNLPPQGIGTPEVESMSSYTKRLAEAHSLLPKTLIWHEIMPHIYDSGKSRKYYNAVNGFFSHYSHTMNGMTSYTERYTQVLQDLTSRRDLRSLTLINLAQVVSNTSMLRDFQAWCPHCYTEQKEQGQEVYDHLLWSIDAVTVCAVHSTPLATYCLSCGQEQRVIRQNSRVGYCHYCNAWLGKCDNKKLTNIDPYSEEDWDWRVWKSQVLAELIANTTAQEHVLSRTHLQSALHAFVIDCAEGNMSTLARWLDIDVQRVWSWKRGRSVPHLAQILAICSRLNISPLGLLTHQSDITKSFEAETTAQQSEALYAVEPRTDISQSQEIKIVLDNVLQEDPPPSMAEVLCRLNRTRPSIRSSFAEEYSAIVKRYQEWKSSSTGRLYLRRLGRRTVATDSTIIRRLEEATEEYPPISLAKVATELRCTTEILKKWHPQQCHIILERYKDAIDWKSVESTLNLALRIQTPPYPSLADLSRQVGVLADSIRGRYPEECREISRRHRHQNVDIMQRELQRAVSEEPPPSLSEVCDRTGHTGGTLKLHFPKLCKEIVCRHAAFVQESALQRAQQLRAEVRQAVLRIHEEGRYPSLGRLYLYLNHSLIMMEPACRDEWRATLEELGYDVDDDE